MTQAKMFTVAGSFVALLALASIDLAGCDDFEVSAAARLYHAAIDPQPLLAGF